MIVLISVLMCAAAYMAGAPMCSVPAGCCHVFMYCYQTHDVDNLFPSCPSDSAQGMHYWVEEAAKCFAEAFVVILVFRNLRTFKC